MQEIENGRRDLRRMESGMPGGVEDAIRDQSAVEVSVIFPCLNEINAVGRCVTDAWQILQRLGYSGEVIVCDNGSTDNSGDYARAVGARVFNEPRKGYGSACRTGLNSARGQVLVLADCDGSYDLADIRPLIFPILNDQADVMLGSRFLKSVPKNSMPFLNRAVGNPFLTCAGRVVSKVPTTDAQSGMKAVARSIYEELDLRCTGPEFTHELLIAIGRSDARIGEIPIGYYPRVGKSKLKRWRAAARHAYFLASTVASDYPSRIISRG